MTRGTEDDASADGPLYDLIELMFFAYRDFVQDADRILAGDGFGRAHHRVLYFVARRPGLTIAELLDILKITKQSLNRVLKDLLDRGYVLNRSGEIDRQHDAREIEIAVAVLDEGARATTMAFLHAMADAPERDGLVASIQRPALPQGVAP